MSNKISTLVGLRNNIEDTKEFYKYFRNIYPNEELVFVSYGSLDNTNSWLFNLNDPHTITFFEEETKTLSDTYNKAAELATGEFIVLCHNDMVISPGFLENLEKYCHKDRVVGYVTVEPPVFPSPRIGKIIQDFGDDFKTFNPEFFKFSSQEQQNSNNQTEDGITFFMSLSREVFLKIGGFDNIFNPFMSEDDDIIKRLKLLGLQCFTSRDSLTYHFVSKTSRFSKEYQEKTQQIERNSNRTFLRKWGSMNSQNRFNVAFVVDNCNLQLLEVLEPWCDRIYCDEQFKVGRAWDYVELEQSSTSFDLSKRVYTLNNDPELENDIVVKFDAHKLNQNNFTIIQNIQNMLEGIEPGIYEVDIFTINVVALINHSKELIFIQK